MISSEMRDAITIGVGLFVVGLVLSFVSVMFNIRSDLAGYRNTEIQSAIHVAEYKEFNKYNGMQVYGEDVVCAIRDFYDRDIRILVNGDGFKYEVDKYKARDNPDLIDIPKLRLKFPVTRKYYAVVVYGQVDLNTVTEAYVPNTINNNVSGIVFFDKGLR